MSQPLQIGRIVSKPDLDDDHIVLRLAREPLRQDPPRVQFVGRSGRVSAQGAPLWRACG